MSQSIIAFQQLGNGGGGITGTLLMFAAIFVIFYFLILRPQQKRQKDRKKLLDSVKKGDKIITAGGVHAKVIGVEEKTLLIEIADNVKVKIERGSIGSVVKEAGSE